MLLPCSCHVLAMLLPCSCHSFAMFLPCARHVLAILVAFLGSPVSRGAVASGVATGMVQWRLRPGTTVTVTGPSRSTASRRASVATATKEAPTPRSGPSCSAGRRPSQRPSESRGARKEQRPFPPADRSRGARSTSRREAGQATPTRKRQSQDAVVGSIAQSRAEHLAKHAGGLRTCPRCRWYHRGGEGRVYFTTFGASFKTVGRCLGLQVLLGLCVCAWAPILRS